MSTSRRTFAKWLGATAASTVGSRPRSPCTCRVYKVSVRLCRAGRGFSATRISLMSAVATFDQALGDKVEDHLRRERQGGAGLRARDPRAGVIRPQPRLHHPRSAS